VAFLGGVVSQAVALPVAAPKVPVPKAWVMWVQELPPQVLLPLAAS
jgi:hypothetical protein